MKKQHNKKGGTKMKFMIKKVLFHNRETMYAIAKVKVREYDGQLPTTDVVVVGNFPNIRKEDEFTADGTWIKHNQYGYQFKITAPHRTMPSSLKDIIKYIKKFTKGVGEVTAKKIVDRFELDTLKIIENDYIRLTEISGISTKKAKNIRSNIVMNKVFEDTAIFFSMYASSCVVDNSLI